MSPKLKLIAAVLLQPLLIAAPGMFARGEIFREITKNCVVKWDTSEHVKNGSGQERHGPSSPGERKLAWSGSCLNGAAHGSGTLSFYVDNRRQYFLVYSAESGLEMDRGETKTSINFNQIQGAGSCQPSGGIQPYAAVFVDEQIEVHSSKIVREIRDHAIKRMTTRCGPSVRPDFLASVHIFFKAAQGNPDYSRGMFFNARFDSNTVYQALRIDAQQWREEHQARARRLAAVAKAEDRRIDDERAEARRQRREAEERAERQRREAERERLEAMARAERERQEAVARAERERREAAERERQRAEEERQRQLQERRAKAAATQRRFIENAHVEAWPTHDELFANPFVFKGKVVMTNTSFEEMVAEDKALFRLYLAGERPTYFISEGVPGSLFRSRNIEVVIAGKVLGITTIRLPLFGEVRVPLVKFVDAHLCQEAGCGDFYPSAIK